MTSRHANGHGRTNTSHSLKRAELASAYNALATELTQQEIKSIGPYTLGRVIGQGSFGKVRLGVHRLTNTRVAIKQVPKSLPGSLNSNSKDPASSPLSLLTREIHHHRRLRHPHVLALYEIIATETNIYLVSELCTGGELFDYLIEKERLSTSEVRRIGGQLILGLHYLHSRGVVHRDLKLENILIDERINVKIADLGFGREYEKGRLMDTWVGTLGYCAPEIVAAQRYHGEAVDVWSLGVILYSLLVGSLPFDDDDEAVMKQAILEARFDIPSWLDEDSANMLTAILVVDPLKRPSLISILDMPFFTRPAPPQTQFPSSPTPSTSVLPITEEEEMDGSVVLQPTSAAPRVSSESSDSERRPPLYTASSSGRRKDSSSHLGPPPVQSPSLSQNAAFSPSMTGAAPPMSRNMSASSAVSLNSMRSHVASPNNTRTPSRTKRRSISSVLSERMNMHHDSHDDEWTDWRIRLLQDIQEDSASFLQLPAERDLLARLADLGFDEGQIKHSVTTNACDSVAATFWILSDKDKRRRVEHRLRRKESRESSHLGAQSDQDVFSGNEIPERPVFDAIEESPTIDKSKFSKQTESASYFVLPTSMSAPSLSQYGSVPSSPSKAVPFYDHDRTPMPLTVALPTSGSVPELATGSLFLDSPAASTPTSLDPEYDSQRRRTRSGSQSVLARASAALGSSLNRVKSDEQSLSPLSTGGLGPSGPSDGKLSPSMQLATLFSRKNTSDKDKERAEQPPPSPMRQSITLSADKRGAATPPLPSQAQTASSDQPSPSSKTQSLTASPAPSSSTATTAPHSRTETRLDHDRGPTNRKGVKSGIFSNFRQWFVADAQKKSQRSKRNTIDASSIHSRNVAYRYAGAPRTGSSPLHTAAYGYSKRPPSSRRSSTGSVPTVALPHHPSTSVSRKSSIASNTGRPRGQLVSPTIGPRRRPSDSSVLSLSDRELSRPSSARSDRVDRSAASASVSASASGGIGSARRHHKTGSFSSATTTSSRPGATHSPKDVFRRPPTVTTVRRMHQSGHHHQSSHRRGHSGSSSVRTTRSSSSSAGEDDSAMHAHDHPILEDVDEEDAESVRLAERSKALSKLSGDWTDMAPVSATTQQTIAPAPTLQRFHSRDSDFSHHSAGSSSRPHSPVIFSAHRSTHVFGAPSQSSHLISKKAPHQLPLRDVFASKRSKANGSSTETTSSAAENDWIDEEDEEDELHAYSGGLGQSTLSRSQSQAKERGKASSTGGSGENDASTSKGSPVPASAIAQESWRAHMPPSATFRKAITITEEEEEE